MKNLAKKVENEKLEKQENLKGNQIKKQNNQEKLEKQKEDYKIIYLFNYKLNILFDLLLKNYAYI